MMYDLQTRPHRNAIGLIHSSLRCALIGSLPGVEWLLGPVLFER